MKEKPLISFCLFAYNQKRYIRKAVEGAFSQTYSPLEIILSDDCSTDRTFEIMKEMAEVYNGSSKIILNRNQKNLGLAEHINKVATIANGEWLVFAAGDDISLPYRTTVLYDLIKSHEKTYYAGSGEILINERGRFVRNVVFEFNKELVLSGSMAAYHKDCFALFGKLDKGVVIEDLVLPYRALLLGNIALINSPLVKYRATTTYDYINFYRKYAYYAPSVDHVFAQRDADVRKHADRHPNDIVKKILDMNDKYRQILNKSYGTKKIIFDIYKAPLLSRIKLLINIESFSGIEKIKMLLLSCQLIRFLYGIILRPFRKTVVKSFTNEILTINIYDVLSKKFIVHVFNDIEL